MGGVILGLLGGAPAQTQTPAELLKAANLAVSEERYDEAVSLMYIYLSEVEDSQAERVIEIAQDMRFQMATLLIELERLDEASVVLQTYLEQSSCAFPRAAHKMLATALYEIEDYEAAVEAALAALQFEPETVRSEDEGGEEEASDVFEQLKQQEEEPPYALAEKTILHLMLAESYFTLARWEESLEPFEFVIEHTEDDQRRGYAIMQVVSALIEIPDYERIVAWIPELYRTDARYDIRVNLALLNAAAALFAEGAYAGALPLYRMMIPRDELIVFQQERLKTLRIEAGLPPELGAEMTADEQLLFGVVDEAEVASNVKDEATGEWLEKPKALIEQEQLLEALKEMPPYEVDVAYRMAEIYRVVDRPFEALAFFEEVYGVNPTNEIGERSVFEMVDLYLTVLNQPEEAEAIAFSHMERFPEGLLPRQLAYALNSYYQPKGEMEAVKSLKPYLDGMVRSNEASIVQYDTELYFMQAVADLTLLNYAGAEASFQYVIEAFPDSHQSANSLYWFAMSKLFLQKYADALPDFVRYREKYATASYAATCVYQIGVCHFGMEAYDEALRWFSRVIEEHPDADVFPEANSMRGDIYGSRGLLDEAIVDYERAVEAARTVNQATYPTFQMAEVFEAEDRYERIIACVETYLYRWGEEADVARALFWIGKTKIQQGLLDEAVGTYLDAIVQYGSNREQEGVDLMIAELVKISSLFLKEEQRKQLLASAGAAVEEAESATLALRLRVMEAELTGRALELGAMFIEELDSLEEASPPVLAVICEASSERKDYRRAEEILELFELYFPDSEYRRAAFKLRVSGQMQQGDFEGALVTIEEAQERYGTEADVAWTQLIKADALRLLGRLDEAAEANVGVLGVRAWRGEPMAQATYQLGQVEEARGESRKAFAYYQRTYFQYKGHAEGYWAAEAYLASARSLQELGLENDRRNTYRAMLFDPFVSSLPQSEEAREVLGSAEVAEIELYIKSGGVTNITVELEGAVQP
jgi:tetratricopeptide (TPR) repeat protein